MQILRRTSGGAAQGGHFASRRTIEVGQGVFAVSGEADVVMTATLGSCVLVCLTDRVGRVGGMTHIFQCVDPGPTGGAFVIVEVEKLINDLMHHGSPKSALEARVAGGARMLGRGRDVGGEIAAVCVEFLRTERIPVTQSDLGGNRARRVRYEPVTNLFEISYPGSNLLDAAPPKRPSVGSDPELF